MNVVVNANPSQITSLDRLKTGQSATIAALDGDACTARRLLSLGFVPGSKVVVRRTAPLRDPVEFYVRGTFVSIRRAEAAIISIRQDNESHEVSLNGAAPLNTHFAAGAQSPL